MKIKYVKLESPSGVPTYRRPSLIPGFPFDNKTIFRTIDQFMEDIRGSEQNSLLALMNQYDLVDFSASKKILGDFRMYDFRDLNSIRAIRYDNKDYFFNGSGQGMMSQIGNSYSSYNMYQNYHKLIDSNDIWNYSINGSALNTLLENQFVKADGTPTPFEVNKDYILGYYMAAYDNIVSAGAADEIESKPLFDDIPELAGQYSYIAYSPKTDGSHSIKTVCMLGIKFYNEDGTTSLFEAEADKPYSTVYGEYPFVPQGFSCVKFKPTKPYTKCCITRRIKNDLLTTADGYLNISYPFITPYTEPKMGSIDRKDILNNEVVLGGNYPEGTSKDAYVSYDLYTQALPCDEDAGNTIIDSTSDTILQYGLTLTSLIYNIGSYPESILSSEKETITKNANTPTEVANQTFGSKFKCYDVTIKGGPIIASSYIKEGVDGFPTPDTGGCSGSGIEAGRKENIYINEGTAILPFYVAPFEDTFFNSKLISGVNNSGIEVYFELDLALTDETYINSLYFPEEHPATAAEFLTAHKEAILNSIKCLLLVGPLISYYDQNMYGDVCGSAYLDLTRNQKNIYTYSELTSAVANWVSQSSSGGAVELGYSRVCFYLDINAYINTMTDAGVQHIGSNYDNIAFPFDIKINNLYMQKLVIPYIEPPRVDPVNTKSYINDKLLDLSQTYSVTDKTGTNKTGVAYNFTTLYGEAVSVDGFTFKPTLRDDKDPLAKYLGTLENTPYELRVMNPEQAKPTGCTLGTFKIKANKFIETISVFLLDVIYSDSPANYGLASVPINLKGNMAGGNLTGFISYIKKSDLLALGLTEAQVNNYDTEYVGFDLTKSDGTSERVLGLCSYSPDGGTIGSYRNHDVNYPSILDLVFTKYPEANIDVYGVVYASYFNNYISKSAPIGDWGKIQYTPNIDAMNITELVMGIKVHTSTEGAFVMSDKMDIILELPNVQEIAYLQVGAYSTYGDQGEYACYRIYASKDGKVWDYLGDSIGLSKTSESNEFYQYLSIDISNIAEPDATKTYSKIKGKVLKVTIPDNNMYLRNTTTGVVTNIPGSKEFAIRDIVINNAGTILDFTLNGLTKLTYNNEVFEGTAADEKFTQLLKDTDFINIDFSNLKAEGNELLINLGSEKEFDTVNIITGKTVTGGIQEMKYAVTVSSDGSTFKDVISMDPAAFTAEMFLKRTGMIVMNNNCFFTDDI